MEVHSLGGLLTGKGLGISKESIDIEGWVAAFRRYTEAGPEERRYLEAGLAEEIKKADDRSFIADAVCLARALVLTSPSMRDAVASARDENPAVNADSIAVEVDRYNRALS